MEILKENIENLDNMTHKISSLPDIFNYTASDAKEEFRKVNNKYQYFVVVGKNITAWWNLDDEVRRCKVIY